MKRKNGSGRFQLQTNRHIHKKEKKNKVDTKQNSSFISIRQSCNGLTQRAEQKEANIDENGQVLLCKLERKRSKQTNNRCRNKQTIDACNHLSRRICSCFRYEHQN